MGFVLKPRELKVLRFNEIPEKHREGVKENFEQNADYLLEAHERDLKHLEELEKSEDFRDWLRIRGLRENAALSKKRVEKFKQNRGFLIKHALMRALNNFHNRFPGYFEDPDFALTYKEIQPTIVSEAEKIEFDLGEWLKKNKELTGYDLVRHRLKLWPLYLRMLNHVEDHFDLTR